MRDVGVDSGECGRRVARRRSSCGQQQLDAQGIVWFGQAAGA